MSHLRRARVRLLPALLLALAACESQYQDNWGRLQRGMTQAQVQELLGDPSSRIAARRDGEEIVVAYDRWQYGDNVSTLATGVVFPSEAPDRVWAVYVDQEGRLIEWRRPYLPQ